MMINKSITWSHNGASNRLLFHVKASGASNRLLFHVKASFDPPSYLVEK